MEKFYRMLENPIFQSALFSILISQFLKGFVDIFKRKPHSLKEILLKFFWSTGGMPSTHSALVTALTTSSAFILGIDSPLFIFSLFYSFYLPDEKKSPAN